MLNVFGNRVQGMLSVHIDISLRWSSYRFIVLKFSGTAENEHADFMKQVFLDVFKHLKVDTVKGIVVDIQDLPYCYSACLRVIMDSLQDLETEYGHDTPNLEILIGTASWQITSVKAMCTMIRGLEVVTSEESVLKECKPIEGSRTCAHTNTDTKEDDFFAPTGNGTIRTRIYCVDCGWILTEKSEYFC
ncbi:hypothetical protein EON65_21485 [archaeon]|nr:MAG: hypothetical protein EON65_21485 [archaeon]